MATWTRSAVTQGATTAYGTLTVTGATQLNNTLSVGVDATGYDVKLFGDTTGKYWLWDQSADGVVLIGTLAQTGNSALIGNSAITGNLSVSGTITLGSNAVLSEAELELLDGITAGTVLASKAVVVDANKDIGSFRHITLTGSLNSAEIDISGAAVFNNIDVDGTANLDAVDIDGATQLDGTFTVGSDGTGMDVIFYSAEAGKLLHWDESLDTLNLKGGLTFGQSGGLSGTTYDAKFWGNGGGEGYMLWDVTQDDLVFGSSVKVGIGVTDPDSPLEIFSGVSSPQLKISFDASNFATAKVSSGGDLELHPSGLDTNIKGTLSVSAAEGASSIITMNADESDDNGDTWQLEASNSATFSIANDLSGSLADLVAIKSSATAANSLFSVKGLVIEEGRGYIKVPFTAFKGNDDSLAIAYGVVSDAASIWSIKVGNANVELIALVDIPYGMTATKVRVFGSDTSNAVEVYNHEISNGVISGELSVSTQTVNDDIALARIDTTCDTTNGSPNIECDSTAGMLIGASVSGTGIPAGVFIASVPTATRFTISKVATQDATNESLTISNLKGTATNHMAIKVVTAATDDLVYGAYIYIEPSIDL